MAKAKQKYLRNIKNGTILGWTKPLEAVPHMVPCDKEGHRIMDIMPAGNNLEATTEMEILGSKFDVPDYLVETIEKVVASKTPDNVVESKTEMVMNGNSHMVPDSMVMDIKSLSNRMIEATEATGGLQESLSKAIEENGELEKDRDRIKEERTSARREATRLKNKYEKEDSD